MKYLEVDHELWPWVFGVLHDEPTRSGDFLRSFCEALQRADPDNYALLRPVAIALRDKYPKYRCNGVHS